MKNKKCFCGIHCVNGSCPRALAHENDTRDDDSLEMYREYKNLSCSKCVYNTDKCEDCAFFNNQNCELNKNKPV